MNPLLGFYLEERPDNRGRLLVSILGKDDDWLEYTHDYIQWLFPLVEASQANPSAPVLDEVTIDAFLREPRLRTNLAAAYHRMLSFYGLRATHDAVIKGPNWSDRKDNWFVEPTHNDLRITRILTSLALLGRRDDARQFLACLQTLRISEADCGFSDEALGYWRSASPPVHACELGATRAGGKSRNVRIDD